MFCILLESGVILNMHFPKNKEWEILYVMGQTIFRSVLWLNRENPMMIKLKFY